MKKISFALTLLLLFTVVCACLPTSAAAPIDSYTRVEKPAASTVRQTVNHFYLVRGVENPVGQWDPNAYADGGMGNGSAFWPINETPTYLDCSNTVAILRYQDHEPHTLSELVFADGFTYSGQGTFGKTRVTPEIWEKISVIVSDDFLNWREVDFTVAYHTETKIDFTQGASEIPVDLYWHLILEETTTAKYFAIHANEPKAWDAMDHAPRLGIIFRNDFFYGVNTSGYEADLSNVRTLYTKFEAQQGEIRNPGFDSDGKLTKDSIQTQSSGWGLYLFDGATRLSPFVGYSQPVWANEIVVADLASLNPDLPFYSDYNDLEVYYADDMDGVWTKANVTGSTYACNDELIGNFRQGIRLVFDELISAKYFILYDPAPQAHELWLSAGTLTAVYDPVNGTDAPPPPPETEPPVETPAPDTEPPATEAPVTEAPATEATTTEVSATEAPSTEANTTTPVEDADNGIAPWIYVVIAVAAVAVIAVVIVIVKKRKA